MSKSNLIKLLIIFLAALSIRLWFLARVQSDPAFHIPVFDPKEFNFWAFQLMQNGWQWHSLQNHTPLYAYFLAVVYKLFGFHTNAVAVVQLLGGSLGACLMYQYVLRVANGFAAGVCAGLMAGYWWLIYTQLYLFSESLAMFLNIVLLLHLSFARESACKYLLAGILLGLSVLCRPEIMFFGLLVLWWMHGRVAGLRRYLVLGGIFMAGLILVVAPVLLRNHQISGSWLLRSQIGANFYIGNRPELLGTNVFLEQGRIWQKFMALPYAAEPAGRVLSEAEINRYFLRETVDYMSEHPFRWLMFMGQKVFTVLSGREYIRSEDVYFRDLFVRDTPFLLISTQAVFVLALAGFILSWRNRKDWQLAGLFLLSMVPAFFFSAKTRYLVPAMPFVMVFASMGAWHLYQAFREKDRAAKLNVFALVFTAGLVSFFNPLNLLEPGPSETHYAIGSNLQYQGNYPLAEKYLRSALLGNSSNCSAWADLGILYIATGRYEEARHCFGRARDIDPGYQRYFELAREMVRSEGSPAGMDCTLRLQGQGDPVVRSYLEHFHYP